LESKLAKKKTTCITTINRTIPTLIFSFYPKVFIAILGQALLSQIFAYIAIAFDFGILLMFYLKD
jgi:hypothetical protein